jgi:hypothetical protein
MARYSPTERIGINAVESAAVKELRWIFREQPIADMGIDAHLEVVVDGEPTGILLAAQIKTGKGNFHETADAYTYYGSITHLNYWTGHSLPVLLVAHLPETGETLWTIVNERNVEKTPTAWKISIPKNNHLNASAVDALKAASEGDPREQKLRRLTLDLPLMRHVAAGHRVSVELEDWYNKSLGRTTVSVFVYDETGKAAVDKEWYQYFIGMNMKELAEALFPWAIARVDHDFYDEHSDIEESKEDALSRILDYDNGISPYVPDADDIYPYSDSSGEVASYHLRLTLNSVGVAFLAVSDYLDSSE